MIDKKGIGTIMLDLISGLLIIIFLIFFTFLFKFAGFDIDEKITGKIADLGTDVKIIGFLRSEDNGISAADKIISGCTKDKIEINDELKNKAEFGLVVECNGKEYDIRGKSCKKYDNIMMPSWDENRIIVRYC